MITASGGAPSPDSPESFLETKIDEQDNIENIKIAAVPVTEEVKAESAAIQMDVEIRSEISVDSSCTREPPRKKMAIGNNSILVLHFVIAKQA